MSDMFNWATAFHQDVSSWDVALVTNMASMFSGAVAFNNGGVALDWADTGLVESTHFMFYNADIFNQSLASWDTSSVTDMYGMFRGANSFTSTSILGWNVSFVIDMQYMFYNNTAFNQDLTGWDVDQVTNYTNFNGGTSILEAGNLPSFP